MPCTMVAPPAWARAKCASRSSTKIHGTWVAPVPSGGGAPGALGAGEVRARVVREDPGDVGGAGAVRRRTARAAASQALPVVAEASDDHRAAAGQELDPVAAAVFAGQHAGCLQAEHIG